MLDHDSKIDIGEEIWQQLLGWLDGGPSLTPEMREEFVRRAKHLRTRIQATFLEIQRRAALSAAVDLETEMEIRRHMRESLPYLTPLERVQTLRALADTRNKAIEKISEQTAGLDMFDAVEFSVDTLIDAATNNKLKTELQGVPGIKRQRLIDTLLTLRKDMIRANTKANDEVESRDV